MKLGTLTIAASVLAMGMVALISPGRAQGPLWDVVHVNLPYTVMVGDRTLEPGEYTIQQNHDSGGGARVLLIYSDKGMKFETSAMTIPALDINTARETKVMLGQVGKDYYMEKVWIQGKDYGYEFPIPQKLKDREKERQSVEVGAKYSTSSPDSTVASNSTAKEQGAAVTTPPVTSPADADRRTDVPVDQAQAMPSNPPQTNTPANPPANPPVVDSSANSANREIDDQASTQPRATTPSPDTASTPSSSSADRSSMPSTSAGWLMMMLGGGSLSGLGLALRRIRS